MIPYDFTRKAEKMFLGLPKHIQKRIIVKIEHYLSQPNPLIFAKRLVNSPIAAYRFQVGDYQIAFDWEGDGILITKVGQRGEVYKR